MTMLNNKIIIKQNVIQYVHKQMLTSIKTKNINCYVFLSENIIFIWMFFLCLIFVYHSGTFTDTHFYIEQKPIGAQFGKCLLSSTPHRSQAIYNFSRNFHLNVVSSNNLFSVDFIIIADSMRAI